MTTKREYAISLGLAQPGRGRLSREAHAAIDKALAEGMTFDDASPKPVVAKTPKTPKPARQNPGRVVVGNDTNIPVIVERYPLDQMFVGYDSNGKKHEVNVRQVCRHCGYSLSSHRCNDPEVLIGSPLEYIRVTPKE